MGWACPPTPLLLWPFEAVISLVSGPFVEGSRIVASSTPDRLSVSYRTPGQAHIENLPHARS